MASATTQENGSSDRSRRRRRILLPRLGEILLLAVAGFCLAILITQDIGVVTRILYSPLAIILLVVVFVEFLIIKGGDRSRLYRIELARMHEREQDQVERTRKAVEELNAALDICNERFKPWESGVTADSSAAAELQTRLVQIGKLLRPDLKE